MNALKLSLDKEYINDYTLIGIACHLKDYRLIYNVNRSLNFDLKKEDDLNIYLSKEKKEVMFSFYRYIGENTEYYVLANRTTDGILIPEYKKIDYFLIVNGLLNDQQENFLIKTISDLSSIMLANKINTTSVKNLDSILTDLELHLIEIGKKEK
jgi:hypothetical protein